LVAENKGKLVGLSLSTRMLVCGPTRFGFCFDNDSRHTLHKTVVEYSFRLVNGNILTTQTGLRPRVLQLFVQPSSSCLCCLSNADTFEFLGSTSFLECFHNG